MIITHDGKDYDPLTTDDVIDILEDCGFDYWERLYLVAVIEEEYHATQRPYSDRQGRVDSILR